MFNVVTRSNDVITYVGRVTHKQYEIETGHLIREDWEFLRSFNAKNGYNLVLRDTQKRSGRPKHIHTVTITYSEAAMDWLLESW